MREEFEDRVKDVEEQDYRELFTLMFYTGLRVGEAMALVWADFNKYKKRYPLVKQWTSLIEQYIHDLKLKVPRTSFLYLNSSLIC